MVQMNATIWTIGHSTRTAEDFLSLLKENDIRVLADVRRFPASRRYPHFNAPELAAFLLQHGIEYRHFPELGGRRNPLKDSIHTEWKNASFRGYADYMDTDEFSKAVSELEQLALRTHVAYMCSEAPWWKCHRGMISDHLKKKGWKVLHIMNPHKTEEHPYTIPARKYEETLFKST